MTTEEMNERSKYQDPRIFYAIQEMKKNDQSFTEKPFLGITPKYSQGEVRDIWFQGIALGMSHGLDMATLQGQRIDLTENCKEPRHREFLEKFYRLAEEYNCAISFHPHKGMCVVDLQNKTDV